MLSLMYSAVAVKHEGVRGREVTAPLLNEYAVWTPEPVWRFFKNSCLAFAGN
jgi:hypothetical protein